MAKRAGRWKHVVAVAAAAGVGALVGYYAWDVVEARSATPTLVRAAMSDTRVVLDADALSPAQLRALLAVQQDPEFFRHKGSNFLGGTRTTVTEALVKRFYFSAFRPGLATIRRTLIARFAVDPLVSKRDQLTLYINYLPLGCVDGQVVEGLAQAAATFCGKRFEDLSYDEYLSLLVTDQPCTLNRRVNPEGNARRVRQIKALLARKCRPPGLFGRSPNCWTEDPG